MTSFLWNVFLCLIAVFGILQMIPLLRKAFAASLRDLKRRVKVK